MHMSGRSNSTEGFFLLSEQIVGVENLDSVYSKIARTAMKLSASDASEIRIYDPSSNLLKVVHREGSVESFSSHLGGGMIAEISNSVMYGSGVVRRLALMSAPLFASDRSIGVLNVFRKRKKAFSENELIVLSVFASHSADTIVRAHMIEELWKRATYDHTTSLYNKQTTIDKLEVEIKSVMRNNYHSSIVFIDIDRFKQFNDTHGHILGDKLLADFAQLLRNSCRETDVIGRFGGEEFVIIAPHTSKDKVAGLMEKLKRNVAGHRFVGQNEDVSISFSAGVATFPDDGTVSTDLIARADEAMYHSKNAGRDRFTIWSEIFPN